jgi:hypothetical protein
MSSTALTGGNKPSFGTLEIIYLKFEDFFTNSSVLSGWTSLSLMSNAGFAENFLNARCASMEFLIQILLV